MAFVSNNSQQLSLMDSTFNLTERERKFLEKSWAKAFADKIFPAINEELFYSWKNLICKIGRAHV